MSQKNGKINFDDVRYRYHRSSRTGKGKLLDELIDLYGYNRKYLLQVFNGCSRKLYPKDKKRAQYTSNELLQALRNIWLATNLMCSKKSKVAIPLWLPFYPAKYEAISEKTKEELLSLSPSTIDRLLKPTRAKYHKHGLSGTHPGYLLKTQIPIKTDHWDVNKPGFMEADTVAHCGDTIAGSYVWSITLTDIDTSWTEIRATWNKGAEGVVQQIRGIKSILPFEILGFDCDNGSEFLNYHLVRYFIGDRRNPVQFTRSRPYRKNDNAHVEQKKLDTCKAYIWNG